MGCDQSRRIADTDFSFRPSCKVEWKKSFCVPQLIEQLNMVKIGAPICKNSDDRFLVQLIHHDYDEYQLMIIIQSDTYQWTYGSTLKLSISHLDKVLHLVSKDTPYLQRDVLHPCFTFSFPTGFRDVVQNYSWLDGKSEQYLDCHFEWNGPTYGLTEEKKIFLIESFRNRIPMVVAIPVYQSMSEKDEEIMVPTAPTAPALTSEILPLLNDDHLSYS